MYKITTSYAIPGFVILLTCGIIFYHEVLRKKVANQLVKITKFHVFNGGLVNIARQIKLQHLKLLKSFVSLLIHEAVGCTDFRFGHLHFQMFYLKKILYFFRSHWCTIELLCLIQTFYLLFFFGSYVSFRKWPPKQTVKKCIQNYS